MKVNGVSLALIGASGLVGTKIIKLLENRAFPVNNFFPLAKTTVGNKIVFNTSEYSIESLEGFDAKKAQLIIIAAGSEVAKQYAKDFVAAGSYVIDLSSHFRYEENVPLVIPEINGHALKELNQPSLIANPNCTTAQLLMALKPIHDSASIQRLNVASYQAVSGTGKAAMEELHGQTYFSEQDNQTQVYPKQIAFNVIPQCDDFLENNFTKEEMKIVWETHKILDPKIFVQSTCVRVPVFNGHSEAVFFNVSKNISYQEVVDILKGSEGIKVFEDPEYPTPVENANDTHDVFVGRIRVQEAFDETWVSMWIVADNVYGKGAALNAVQICEDLLKYSKLK
jgi:aspartate-semialdehyde dehydrogenase